MTASSPPPDTASEQRIATKAAAKASESVREKITAAIFGFILTGVIGTMLTTWVQQRGWSWQNRVTKIEKDTDNAMATYRTASELINARWHATYRMTRALERQSTGEEWKAAKENFDSTDKDWALRYTNVARDVEFHVDTPFAIDSREDMNKVWALSCSDYAFSQPQSSATPAGPPLTVTSARIILEVINHCHGRMKDEIDDFADKRNSASVSERKALTELSYRRLDHLYRTNEILRCVIFERALAIRGTATAESYWGTFFGVGAVNYTLPEKKRGCLI
ncbi:MAG: hypothetical protein ACRCTD_04680 [Beijerinckiaceae bacterium]